MSQLQQRIKLYEQQLSVTIPTVDGRFFVHFLINHGLVKTEEILGKQMINDEEFMVPIATERLPQNWWQEWFTSNPFTNQQVQLTPEGWRTLIQYVKSKVKENKQFRPLSTGDAVAYLHGAGLFRQEYFTGDPVTDSLATLTRDGMKQILIHMGFLINEPVAPLQRQ